MKTSLKTGDWLTTERLKVYPLLLLAGMLFGFVYLLMTSHNMLDRRGHPVGTDFSNVWNAGAMVLEGRAAEAYDPKLHYKKQQETFGEDVPFYGWHYPPFFLIIAAGLALLPYGLGYLTWMGLTLPLYLASIRLLTKNRHILIGALAFPAVFVNLGHGQNGFVTAALIGSALYFLDRRPLLAGLLIGLLAYKPQFGILIPLVLIATGRWQAFIAAGATVLGLSLLSTLLWGIDIWAAFLHFGEFTRTEILEQGATGWQKIQSLFSAVRALGGSIGLAYTLQFSLLVVIATLLALLWRSAAAFELKAAALVTGSLLATPYVLDYDMMALAPALVFVWLYGRKHGFADYEKSLLAFVWLVPLITRPVAQITLVPLGLLAMLAFFSMILFKAWPQLKAALPLRQVAA